MKIYVFDVKAIIHQPIKEEWEAKCETWRIRGILRYWLLIMKRRCIKWWTIGTERYLSDRWWKKKVKKYFHFWLYACVFLLWKFSCFLSYYCRRTWRLAFWVLWRLACCSQNTVAKAQQSIVTSRCLHLPLSRKRKYSVCRTPVKLYMAL